MSPKILKRCDLCGKFHAAYVVEDAELGKLNLCYSCWHVKFAPKTESVTITERTVAGAEATSPTQTKK